MGYNENITVRTCLQEAIYNAIKRYLCALEYESEHKNSQSEDSISLSRIYKEMREDMYNKLERRIGHKLGPDDIEMLIKQTEICISELYD